jgi:ribosome-binding ATPase YchF (GTP1/OBG family)
VSLAHELRKNTKPIVVAANKKDVAPRQMMERVTQACKDAVPTSGAAELALRLAHQKGAIDYVPGNTHFHIIGQVNQEQRRALERLQHFVTQTGTGVQACLNKVVFDILKYIIVYPVEDENRLSDKEGRILPDAFLIKAGQTTRDLAFKIHSDIGKGFIYAVDARTKKRLGEHHALEDGDIIKIVTTSRAK